MLKHGDIDNSTGLVFWSKTRGNECWLDPIKYLFKKNTVHKKSRIKYALNLTESRTRVREYGRANSAMKNASYKKWSQKNAAKIKDSRLKRTYGISGEDYEEMFKQQNGKCEICETQHLILCVDHCHKTGMVRKLLCHNCNTGIGQLKDNPNLLTKAADYIKKHTFDPDISGNTPILKPQAQVA